MPAPEERPGQEVGDGLLVVDKPSGWTSHDVVGRVRRLCRTRRVGHAGTLDPMATGVLVLGVNKGTKLLTFLVGQDKAYAATVRLGRSTLTDDAEGEVTGGSDAGRIAEDDVARAVAALTGRGPRCERVSACHRTWSPAPGSWEWERFDSADCDRGSLVMGGESGLRARSARCPPKRLTHCPASI